MSSWQQLGACLGEDPDSFFGDDAEPGEFSYEIAYALCEGCPVRRMCLMAGLAGREYKYTGMWGGATPVQLKRLARHSRHGKAALFCERCGTDRDFIKVVDQGWRYCCDK
jgi:hypothetical protein